MKVYEINDGYDGFIVAKSLKQAINLVYPLYCSRDKKSEILKQCKNPQSNSDWLVTSITKVGKHTKVGQYKLYRKSQVLGFSE